MKETPLREQCDASFLGSEDPEWLGGHQAKEHLLSVGKDCPGSSTEVSEMRSLPQVRNGLGGIKISLALVPKQPHV